MSKFCPVIKEKVLYPECLECEDKECKNPAEDNNKEDEEEELE